MLIFKTLPWLKWKHKKTKDGCCICSSLKVGSFLGIFKYLFLKSIFRELFVRLLICLFVLFCVFVCVSYAFSVTLSHLNFWIGNLFGQDLTMFLSVKWQLSALSSRYVRDHGNGQITFGLVEWPDPILLYTTLPCLSARVVSRAWICDLLVIRWQLLQSLV